MQDLPKALNKMMAEIELLDGEGIQHAIQADGFFMGANPLLKAVAAFQALVTTLTGGHNRVFVIITNMRIILVQSQSVFCGFGRKKRFNAIALASLAECGWSKETQFCCVNSRALHVESKTQRHILMIKKMGDVEMRGFVSRLSEVMLSNVASGTIT